MGHGPAAKLLADPENDCAAAHRGRARARPGRRGPALDRFEQANSAAQWIWVILSSLASQAVTAQLAGWEVGHTNRAHGPGRVTIRRF